jgi:pyridoxine 5-phosphate synthase
MRFSVVAVFSTRCVRRILDAMARLSVNLNKVALLRNSRHTGVPDLPRFAHIVHEAGAHGITVHPRPDERHIRRSDVPALAAVMQPWRPAFELNIEGYPDERLLEIVAAARPEQCTLVPDAPGAFTSEEGWKLDNAEHARLRPMIVALKRLGCRVILFVDPDPAVVARVPASGADGIEIYTGSYAAAFKLGQHADLLGACAETARRAAAAGLVVNAGHDLNLDNLPALVAALPSLAEASIGHELTADALVMGFGPAVAAYREALAGR